MRTALILLIPCLLLIACKKDSDDEAPTVTITAPLDGLTIIMPDTIAVAATAQDNEQLEILNFGLVDENLNWVGERIFISDPSNPSSFNIALPVTDLDIASGTHFVEVLAGDGTNDEREFVEVNVIAIPRTYLGTAFKYPLGGAMVVGFQDVSGELTDLASDGDIFYAGDGRNGAAYVYYTGLNLLVSEDIDSGEMIWGSSEAVQAGESVVDMIYDPMVRRIYLLTDEPQIYAYSYLGSSFGNFEVDADYEVISFMESGEDIWLLSNSTTGHRLSRIFKSSGLEIEHFTLPYEPLRMAMFSPQDIVLVDTEGEVHLLDTQTGSQFGIPSAAGGDVNALVAVNGRAYFSSGQGVYRFDPSSAQVPQVHASNSITGMTYDEVGQRMIIADGSELRFYEPTLWQFLGSISAPQGASDLQALFNK